MARTAGTKKINTRDEMLAICKALDSGIPQSLVELTIMVNGLRKKNGEKPLVDGDDLYQNHIRRLRHILEEAQELGEIDDEKDIKRRNNHVIAFPGIYDLYTNRGRRNMIPSEVIEFVRGNVNYAVLNQIQNWILDKGAAGKKSKKPKLPEKFISIEDSLYIGEDKDKKTEMMKEQKHLLFLAKCILSKKAVTISYHPNALGGEKDELTFSPEYLRRVGRKWMVYGMSKSTHFKETKYVNLVLGRIEKITESNEPYTPSGVDYTDDPFKDQMTFHGFPVCSGKKEKVVLKVRKEKPGYTSGTKIYPFVRIVQEPLHHSQAVIEEDQDYGYISIEVTDAMSIRPILLTWGADLEVCEPQALREQMKQEIATMQSMYAKETGR